MGVSEDVKANIVSHLRALADGIEGDVIDAISVTVTRPEIDLSAERVFITNQLTTSVTWIYKKPSLVVE